MNLSEQRQIDLFQDWSNNPFVIIPSAEVGPEYEQVCSHVVVLTDIGRWHLASEQLQSWCRDTGCVQQGMIVLLPDEAQALAFMLRWR